MESANEMDVTASHSVYLGQFLIGFGRGADDSHVILSKTRMRALMFGMGFQLKMIRAHASFLLTHVMYKKAFRNWADVLLPGATMGTLWSTEAALPSTNHSVSVFVFSAFCDPAKRVVTSLFDRVARRVGYLKKLTRVVTLEIGHGLALHMPVSRPLSQLGLLAATTETQAAGLIHRRIFA